MVENQYKHILKNARTYQGTLTISDHRLLITWLQTQWFKVHKHKNIKSNNKKEKYDTQKLINDPETQNNYKKEVQKKISEMQTKDWKSITNAKNGP